MKRVGGSGAGGGSLFQTTNVAQTDVAPAGIIKSRFRQILGCLRKCQRPVLETFQTLTVALIFGREEKWRRSGTEKCHGDLFVLNLSLVK